MVSLVTTGSGVRTLTVRNRFGGCVTLTDFEMGSAEAEFVNNLVYAAKRTTVFESPHIHHEELSFEGLWARGGYQYVSYLRPTLGEVPFWGPSAEEL